MQQPGLLFRTPCRDELLRQTGLDPGCAVYLHRRRACPQGLPHLLPAVNPPARDQHDGQLQRRDLQECVEHLREGQRPIYPAAHNSTRQWRRLPAFPLRTASTLRGGCAITSASAPPSTKRRRQDSGTRQRQLHPHRQFTL